MEVTKTCLILLLFFLMSSSCNQTRTISEATKHSKQDFVIGETVTLQSSILKEERILNIYLPPEYGLDPMKKYSVIYLLDGSHDEDFIHIVGLAQFANFPWVKMLEPTIIVGIANVDRKRDFTYPSQNTQDNEELPTSGGSNHFIDYIEQEVQSYISTNYQVNNNRTIIGQSLGGLLATEILYTRPNLFTNYIIVSPSLWWDDRSLLNDELTATFDEKKTVYLAVGKEGEIMESVAKQLNEKLMNTGEEDIRFYFDYMEEVDHSNILHLAVYKAFERFYSC